MMRTYLKILSISLFLLLTVLPLYGQSNGEEQRIAPPDIHELMSVRERFVYNVRYSFFNLGEIEVELMPDTLWNGRPVQRMRTIMRSGSGVPFVRNRNVHYQNFFTYTPEAMYSHRFWRSDLHDDEPERSEIIFDREAGLVLFFERGEPRDTLELVEPASGGDVIFFYSRMFAGTEQAYRLPVFIDDELGMVSAVSSPETELRSYDAFSEPIETYESEGVADIDGPFGFTGRFRSWFATDERRIPVEAHVRVLFGNVRITLKSYEIIDERSNDPISTTSTSRKP
ncbi:MAG: DUF3108 domain-containing protein [Balneolaceae bacterium]